MVRSGYTPETTARPSDSILDHGKRRPARPGTVTKIPTLSEKGKNKGRQDQMREVSKDLIDVKLSVSPSREDQRVLQERERNATK